MKIRVHIVALRLAARTRALRLRAKIGWFLWYLRRYDAAQLSDAQLLALHKAREDLTTAAEALAGQFAKPLDEMPHAADVLELWFTSGREFASPAAAGGDATVTAGKAVADGLQVAQEQLTAIDKPLVDPALLGDAFELQVAFDRSFDDLAMAVDAATRQASKALGGVSYATETYFAEDYIAPEGVVFARSAPALALTLGKADAARSTDAAVRRPIKALVDSAGSADSGVLVSQGYCDLSYLADNYVGTRLSF